MKKYVTILFIGLFYFSFVTSAQTKSFKRGVAVNNLSKAEVEALGVGTSWIYSWGLDKAPGDAYLKDNGIIFIPMAWNGNINKTAARNLLRAHPEIKYILGFNEPNFTDQARMTPQQAAQKWPDIEEIADEFGLTIVGPALNHSPNPPYQDPIKWYDEFFAACKDCRVDHIAMHVYMPSADAIRNDVSKYKKYKKPIWLTEFCAWENTTTAKSQKQMMISTLDYLETDPDIYRYAWFKDKGWSGGHPYMQLLEENGGKLKELGEVFVNMSSYDDNFYHLTDRQIQSEHYIRMNRINMEKTTDVNGKINVYDMNTTAWMDYNVNIPEAGEYNIFFRISSEYGDDSEIYVSVGGREIATKLFEEKGVGVWNTQSVKGVFAAGKQKIRIGFKKGGLRLNWWGISKSADSPSEIETVIADGVAVFPNPVKDILNIQTSGNTSEVSLFDISGKCIYFGKNVKEIPMSDFAQGLYMLDVRTENGERVVEKILKEN